jgi:hypothetical protein
LYAFTLIALAVTLGAVTIREAKEDSANGREDADRL